jgi:hypothetical protein
LWIHKPRIIGETVINTFDVWTNETFSVRQSENEYIEFEFNGAKVREIKNDYGVIPFVLIQMAKTNQYQLNQAGGALWELVKAQLDYNRVSITQNNNLIYNGFSLLMFVNTGLSGAPRVGAGQAIVMDGVTVDNGEIPPAIDVISPGTQYNEMQDLKLNQIKQTLRNLELPTSMISEDAGLQSGVAMKIERMGLDEYRRNDINLFKKVENRLINMSSIVLSYDGSSNYRGSFGGDYDVTIDYIEFNTPIDETVYFEQTNTLYNKGLISTKEYLNRMTGKEFGTDEEAKAYIETNLANKISGGDELNDSADSKTDNKNDDSQLKTLENPNSFEQFGVDI